MPNRIIALVPARDGSKGLRNKNVRDFDGSPLAVHAINTALHSGIFSKIILSTNIPTLLERSWEGMDITLHNRSEENAGDNSLIVDLLSEVMEDFHLERDLHFMLLQPTSPLRTAYDIIQAYKTYVEGGYDALVSVSKPFNHPRDCIPLKNTDGNNNGLSPILTMPRQAFREVAFVNGAIYISTIERYISTKTFIMDNLGFFWMPKGRSIDIDDLEDFVVCEMLWKSIKDHS